MLCSIFSFRGSVQKRAAIKLTLSKPKTRRRKNIDTRYYKQVLSYSEVERIIIMNIKIMKINYVPEISAIHHVDTSGL